MSASATLDRAFADLLGKLRSEAAGAALPPAAREATINITFSGGGSALPTAGLGGVVEIPFPCRIVWAHMFAGNEQIQAVDVTASVGLWVGSFEAWPSGSPIWGEAQPSLSAASHANIDISTWITNLVTADILYYVITSFVGTATWMSVHLGIRSTAGEEGTADIVSAAGDQVVDEDGNELRFRE